MFETFHFFHFFTVFALFRSLRAAWSLGLCLPGRFAAKRTTGAWPPRLQLGAVFLSCAWVCDARLLVFCGAKKTAQRLSIWGQKLRNAFQAFSG